MSRSMAGSASATSLRASRHRRAPSIADNENGHPTFPVLAILESVQVIGNTFQSCVENIGSFTVQAALFQCPQAANQVSIVDRRDEARCYRLQRARVVPVVQLTVQFGMWSTDSNVFPYPRQTQEVSGTHVHCRSLELSTDQVVVKRGARLMTRVLARYQVSANFLRACLNSGTNAMCATPERRSKLRPLHPFSHSNIVGRLSHCTIGWKRPNTSNGSAP